MVESGTRPSAPTSAKRSTSLSLRSSVQAPDASTVREDPERRGLLYAGTETGVYVSFDAGASWQPFSRNLPAVPVTDLEVRHGDHEVRFPANFRSIRWKARSGWGSSRTNTRS